MESAEFAKLNAYMETNHALLKETRLDVKAVLVANARTEERLKTGAKRFDDHEGRIRKVEKWRISPKTVYAMIGVGFLALGALIAVVGL